MKRVGNATSLCLCALLFAGSLFAGEPSNTGSSLGDINLADREERALEDLLLPEDIIQRSLIPTAQAWFDYTDSTIEVEFNRPVGNVIITITDAQGAVITTLRASSETPILLPLPLKGSYKMSVAGEKYLGKLDFVID